MTQIPSTASLTLDLPPSCIAFCPLHPEFFVVGTYYLHPQEQNNAGDQIHASDDDTILDQGQRRTGSLILFRLDGDEIEKMATQPTNAAVLDIQWTPHYSQIGPVLAVATSTGHLLFFRLEGHTLLPLSTKVVAEASTLLLSLSWHPTRKNVLGLTLSDGSVVLCHSSDPDPDPWDANTNLTLTTLNPHTLEAWTLAFTNEGTTLLTGGDDAVLASSDLQNPDPEPQWRDRRLHTAGVTAILPLTPTLVVTGSYDDHIRLITLKATGRRKLLADLDLGGGVWRLKRLQTPTIPAEREGGEGMGVEGITILASCMHAGSRVVRLSLQESNDGEEVWGFEVLARFEEHGSMNYGADVQPCLNDEVVGVGRNVVSISFYDRLMCLWRYRPEGG